MSHTVTGRRLDNDEAILFHIEIDGTVHRCLVSRELLNDLSRSTSSGARLLDEFDAHTDLIAEKTEMAIRAGMTGDPLLIPPEMFFPRGRPLHKLMGE